MEDGSIFYGHLVYFTAIWYTLWQFGIFYGYLVYNFKFLSCPDWGENPESFDLNFFSTPPLKHSGFPSLHTYF
jgi:hypothetical protein